MHLCGLLEWNVVSNTDRSCSIPRKSELVVQELRRLGIVLAGLSETRWLGQGIVDVDGYTFLYSGRPIGDEKLEGVGIMLGGICKRAWENGGE